MILRIPDIVTNEAGGMRKQTSLKMTSFPSNDKMSASITINSPLGRPGDKAIS